jgi:hypothetical protein
VDDRSAPRGSARGISSRDEIAISRADGSVDVVGVGAVAILWRVKLCCRADPVDRLPESSILRRHTLRNAVDAIEEGQNGLVVFIVRPSPRGRFVALHLLPLHVAWVGLPHGVRVEEIELRSDLIPIVWPLRRSAFRIHLLDSVEERCT